MSKRNEEYTSDEFNTLGAAAVSIIERANKALQYGPDMPSSRASCLEDVASIAARVTKANKKPVTPQVPALPGVTPLGLKPNKSKEQMINERAQDIDGWAHSIEMYMALDGSNGADVLKWARLIKLAAAEIARLTGPEVR